MYVTDSGELKLMSDADDLIIEIQLPEWMENADIGTQARYRCSIKRALRKYLDSCFNGSDKIRSEDMFNRERIVKDLIERIENKNNNIRMYVDFDRPYTIGVLVCSKALVQYYVGPPFSGEGFKPLVVVVEAKMCESDEWSKNRGKEIVIVRAARKMADEIVQMQLESVYILE